MRTAKIFLVILFFIFSLTTIFSTPGRSAYENFLYSIKAKTDNFYQVSPGTQIILIETSKAFPIDPSEILFYRQNAWYVQKYVLYISYILTWVTLIYFARTIKSKLSGLSISLAFFLSFPLLQAVSLTFFEIFAAPFFVLSLTFYYRKKYFHWLIALLVSILLNWQFIILLPIFVSQIKFGKLNLAKLLDKSLLYLGTFILIFLFPHYNTGQLIWLVLLAILRYTVSPSELEKHKLFLINFIVFILFYRFFSFYGQIPIRDTYFQFFRYVFSAFFIFYQVWNSKMILRKSFRLNTLKLFTIAFSVLVLLSHVTAVGDPDVDNWAKYTRAVVKYVNPFYAHMQVIQLYAPFSTVIMGGFAQAWHYLIGPSPDYAIATKLGILFFLLWTIYLLVKVKHRKLRLIDKLLTVSTTFILINQTLGFGDINIYMIPFIFLSATYLYRNKFFLSGVFIALAVSIKWQPMILLPLYAVAIFDIRGPIIRGIKNSFSFLLGFVPIAIGFWVILIIQPGGLDRFETVYNLYTKEGVYLSGLALNYNWILSYIYPILNPEAIGYSLGLGKLNQVVPIIRVPKEITSYYFFWLVLSGLVIRYWFLKKKNLLVFMATCSLIFFSHYSLNLSAQNLHFFYQTVFMLFVYFLNPTPANRILLILFDAMAIVGNVMFYGFVGEAVINRLLFGVDITLVLSVLYMVIYFWVFLSYIKGDLVSERI